MIPIDHSHALHDGLLDQAFADDELTREEKVYGLFPHFEPYINEASVLAAGRRLNVISADFVEECINNIPAPWRPSMATCDQLAEFVVGRAEFLLEWLPGRLLRQAPLPGTFLGSVS